MKNKKPKTKKPKGLTSKNSPKEEVPTLTRHSEGIFKVAFIGEATQKDYTFKDCTPKEWHNIGKFLDNWVGKPVRQVNSLKKRDDDKNDVWTTKSGEKVNIKHYEYSQSGRLHGYNMDGYFIVTRIDPNHDFQQ